MSNFRVFDARLQHPFCLIVTGPPRSGKSTFVCNLIEHSNHLVNGKFQQIVWFYGERSDTIAYLHAAYGDRVKTVRGLPDELEPYLKPQSLLIFDDLYAETSASRAISTLFTRQSHHRNISVVLITQNLFSEGRERRTIVKSAHYLALFNNPLDKSIAYSLGHRIMPKKIRVFMDIYDEATNKPNGVLFIDGTQNVVPEARFRSDLFNRQFQRVYIPL